LDVRLPGRRTGLIAAAATAVVAVTAGALAIMVPGDDPPADTGPATEAVVAASSAPTEPSQPPATAGPAPSSSAVARLEAAPPSRRAPGTGTGLDEPAKKDLAMRLVSSAENSSLDWRAQYTYIQDIDDGRGYTAGIVGFCSGTGDMLALVEEYARRAPGNVLAKYLPALRSVNGSSSHDGLDPGFTADWKAAAKDPAFQRTQDAERDRIYFNPAVSRAKLDGLRALGQFAYFDAIVMHGPGSGSASFSGIRQAALAKAKPPAQGGDETAYLTAFLDARRAAMRTEAAHRDTSRVDTAQLAFLRAGNLDLATPLTWSMYGEPYRIA
jgi:chitosanase